jgi:folate-dependent tRNA-U54 methylase TrmFO/GidA
MDEGTEGYIRGSGSGLVAAMNGGTESESGDPECSNAENYLVSA